MSADLSVEDRIRLIRLEVQTKQDELEHVKLSIWQASNAYADDDMDSYRRRGLDNLRIKELQAKEARLKNEISELTGRHVDLLAARAQIPSLTQKRYTVDQQEASH